MLGRMCELAEGTGRALPRARATGAARSLADLGRELAPRTDPERTALVTGDAAGQLRRARPARRPAGRRPARPAASTGTTGWWSNCPTASSSWWSVSRCSAWRALPVLALPAHRRAEIGHLCAHTEAVAYVTVDQVQGFDLRKLAAEVRAESPSLRARVRRRRPRRVHRPRRAWTPTPVPLPAPGPADVAFFLLSGGTTGLPKLIPRTHDDYAYQLRATAAAMRLRARTASTSPRCRSPTTPPSAAPACSARCTWAPRSCWPAAPAPTRRSR